MKKLGLVILSSLSFPAFAGVTTLAIQVQNSSVCEERVIVQPSNARF